MESRGEPCWEIRAYSWRLVWAPRSRQGHKDDARCTLLHHLDRARGGVCQQGQRSGVAGAHAFGILLRFQLSATAFSNILIETRKSFSELIFLPSAVQREACPEHRLWRGLHQAAPDVQVCLRTLSCLQNSKTDLHRVLPHKCIRRV